MTRFQLEHIIRAAGAITECDDFVIIESQAIHASIENPPEEIIYSNEADIYPLNEPQKSDLIDGAIGEKSFFHEEFSYYAHGIGPETAKMPSNWKERTVNISSEYTRGVTAICPSVADIAISKLIANREKDIKYVSLLLKYEYINEKELLGLISEVDEKYVSLVKKNINICMNK